MKSVLTVPKTRNTSRPDSRITEFAAAALTAALQAVASRFCETVREALRPTSAAAGLARDASRTRAELLAENAILRQQLIVATRTVRRPPLTSKDRTLMVLVSAFCRTW